MGTTSDEIRVVVAFGGNALMEDDEPGHQEDQMRRADDLAAALMPLIQRGNRLLLVHGNGPQVGNALIRVEAAASRVPGLALDACVAETEGSIGYVLESAFRNALPDSRAEDGVATILTMVEVDGDDPGFAKPTKPVGPFYSRYRAEYLKRVFGWSVVEDAGRGYRRVVASPKPRRVLQAALIESLLSRAAVVVAGGGGGIPVVGRDGRLEGVEAVIDKDHTASLLAGEVGAELLLLLTTVDRVFVDYGKKTEKPLSRLSPDEADRLLDEGQFPPGSMGPKVSAAASFVRSGAGRRSLITSASALGNALEGRGGTWIRQGDNP